MEEQFAQILSELSAINVKLAVLEARPDLEERLRSLELANAENKVRVGFITGILGAVAGSGSLVYTILQNSG